MSSTNVIASEQIHAFESRVPETHRTVLDNVDGTKTDVNTWFEPSEGTLPPPLLQEHFEETMKMPEDQKERLRARMKGNPK